MKRISAAFRRFEAFMDPKDDPQEPIYDPVHLASILIVFMVCCGVLFWLLWTLLVYEGGLFLKIQAGLDIVRGAKTLKDYGYEGTPYAMGVFEGWLGNVIALVLTVVAVGALHRLYWDAAHKAARKPHHG